jgi:hypothetical protein
VLIPGLTTRLIQPYVPFGVSPVVTDKAAQFSGTTKLVRANTGGIFNPPLGTDLVVSFWLCFDTLPTSGAAEIVNVSGGGLVGKDGWFVFLPAATKFLSFGCSDGSGYASLGLASALSAGTWYFASLFWDNSGGEATFAGTLYSCAGVLNSSSVSGRFINAGDPQPLNIGGGVGLQQNSICRIDKLGIWRIVAPASGPPAAAMWNGGAGRTYSQVVAAGLDSGLTAYYDCDQATGAATWPDGTGAYNATASGTVVSVPPHCQF